MFNNPLRYTDPSGYNYKPDDWELGGSGLISYIPFNPRITENPFGRNYNADMYFEWAILHSNGVTNTRYFDFLKSGGMFALNGENVLNGMDAWKFFAEATGGFVSNLVFDNANNASFFGDINGYGFSKSIPYYEITGFYENSHPLFDVTRNVFSNLNFELSLSLGPQIGGNFLQNGGYLNIASVELFSAKREFGDFSLKYAFDGDGKAKIRNSAYFFGMGIIHQFDGLRYGSENEEWIFSFSKFPFLYKQIYDSIFSVTNMYGVGISFRASFIIGIEARVAYEIKP